MPPVTGPILEANGLLSLRSAGVSRGRMVNRPPSMDGVMIRVFVVQVSHVVRGGRKSTGRNSARNANNNRGAN
jgi:hypothetical protein